MHVNDVLSFRNDYDKFEYIYDDSLFLEGFHIYIGNQMMLSENPTASANHTPHTVFH